MKHVSNSSSRLGALLKRMSSMTAPMPQDEDDPICMLIYSFFLWESTSKAALKTWRGYRDCFVDFNDFRVSLPYEMMSILEMRDSRALDRCQRVRAVLNDIYRRERAVSLDRLRHESKREVKKYLESLEGVVPYVASRVALLCFESHAMPVDEQLRSLLIEESIGDDSIDVTELSNWLTRQVKAADARAAHLSLQAWSDDAADRIRKGSSTGSARRSRAGKTKDSGTNRRAKKA